MAWNGLTWTCMVCGAERPDPMISVFKKTVTLKPSMITMTVNVRYCNDRDACINGAPGVADRMAEVTG